MQPVKMSERLRERNLLPLRDGKSEVWGYFGFSQHSDGRITDLSKVCMSIGIAQASQIDTIARVLIYVAGLDSTSIS